MNIENLSIKEMISLLEGSQAVAFAVASTKDERYQFVDTVLKRYSYNSLKRPEKGVLIRFLEKVSGYSRQQLTRMIKRSSDCGGVKRYQRTDNGFNRIYQPEDLHLLAQLDRRHDTPNGLRSYANAPIITSMKRGMSNWPISPSRTYTIYPSLPVTLNIAIIMKKQRAPKGFTSAKERNHF